MCFLLSCERPGAFSMVGSDVEMRNRSLNVKDTNISSVPGVEQ